MATQAANPYKEAVDVTKEMGGDSLRLCYQCGLCAGVFPWNLLTGFIVRRLIQKAQLGMRLARIGGEGRASLASWRRKTLAAAGAMARG